MRLNFTLKFNIGFRVQLILLNGKAPIFVHWNDPSAAAETSRQKETEWLVYSPILVNGWMAGTLELTIGTEFVAAL